MAMGDASRYFARVILAAAMFLASFTVLAIGIPNPTTVAIRDDGSITAQPIIPPLEPYLRTTLYPAFLNFTATYLHYPIDLAAVPSFLWSLLISLIVLLLFALATRAPEPKA